MSHSFVLLYTCMSLVDLVETGKNGSCFRIMFQADWECYIHLILKDATLKRSKADLQNMVQPPLIYEI